MAVYESDDRIIQEVKNLIALGYEGSFWDYKEDYPEKQEDKLHDIICMANNLENRDAYLLYGVDDAGNVVGIEGTKHARYTSKGIMEFLQTKDFAGGYIPNVCVTTIKDGEHEIDILRVFNSNHTPYYLQKSFGRDHDKSRHLRAGAIYTRVYDSNTPIDGTALNDHAEYLWRKRFGLDLTPFMRFRHYLQDEKWSEANWDTVRHNYYIPQPEYQIVVGESVDYYENLRYFYDDERMMAAPLVLRYLTTTLFETQLWFMDMGRCIIPKPLKKVIGSYLYYYFILDDINGEILKRITGGRYICRDRSGIPVPVLIFHNNEERTLFESSISTLEIDKAWETIKSSTLLQHKIAKEERDGKHQIGGVKEIAIIFEIYKQWQERIDWKL